MLTWTISTTNAPRLPLPECAGNVEAELFAAKDAAEAVPENAAWRAIGAADAYARAPLQQDYFAQIVTNAWIKMWQFMLEYNLLVSLQQAALNGKSVLTAFFNAELPGAFISATNHFCAQAGVTLDWVASSYVPASSDRSEEATHILDDKHGLLRGNPNRWLVSRSSADADPQNDGDLRRLSEVRRLGDEVQRRYDGGVSLYTADGGIDASGDYNQQEMLNAQLHLGQALAGLLALRRGGVMIVKHYTLFRAQNATMAVLLSQCFRVFEVAKPDASRPGNSESYLVGLGFRGRKAAAVQQAIAAMSARLEGQQLGAPLHTLMASADDPLPLGKWAEDPLARVCAATEALSRRQAGVLMAAAEGTLEAATHEQKREVIAALGIKPLPREARLRLRRK